MPWPLFNRPSIQLGTLKAYLETNADWIEVDTEHPYLEVASILGTELYHWISQNVWVSEALYGPLIFPGQKSSSRALAVKLAAAADSAITETFAYDRVLKKLKTQIDSWVSRCDWSQYDVVGFSVCFNQLLASLTAASLIKKKCPEVKIVFGGSSCAASAGRSILDTFEYIDFVIHGEGEKPLLELCRYMSGRSINRPANVFTKPAGNPDNPGSTSQITALKELPVPRYDEYFTEMRKWFPDQPFMPVLPVEFSRGCWWNKCAFCNLNLQWCGYRFKKAKQMYDEVAGLSAKYGCLDFTFTDNMIPPKESFKFFSLTNANPSDWSFFAEIRPVSENETIGRTLSLYRSGGLSTVQVGIESLSNSLLKRMRKGVSVIENIATMRGAQEHFLALEGNIIIQFPGSEQTEVDETLINLDYVFSYSPLSIAVFFLGHNSPVSLSPKDFGIKTITSHPNNSRIFPRNVLKKMDLIVQDYRGDRTEQKKMWKPVISKVNKWQKYHEQRKVSALQKPLLYFRDGGDFLIIRQEKIDGTVLNHRLRDTSRKIYLYCTRIRTDDELTEKFPRISRDNMQVFLADLMKKKLLFTDNKKHLALAVHRRGI